MSEVRLGVLALQGAFREHIARLKRLNGEAAEVRLARELDDLDGLIIPGGESTSMGLVAERWGLVEPLRQWVHGGRPTWGTCAGMIVVANRLTDRRPEPLRLMDIEVSRNAFGRQVDSFEADIEFEDIDGAPFHCVFIRAPVVNSVGESVKVLAVLEDGRPMAVRQGRVLATAFHPELTGDSRIHEMFVRMAERQNERS